MRRKVCQIGPSTLMVSLPSRWAKKLDIVKGDELEVKEEAHSLLLSKPSRTSEHSEISLDFREVPNTGMQWRQFMAAYRAGYTEITIQFDPKNQARVGEIRGMVGSFIGMEIMDQRPTSFTVREISIVKAEEFDNIFKKAFLSLIQTGEDLTLASERHDVETFGTVVGHYDEKINRFTDYGIRILHKDKAFFGERVPYLFSFFLLLENIGDRWKALAKELLHSKRILREECVSIQQLAEIMKTGYDTFYSFDEAHLSAFHVRKGALGDTLNQFSEKYQRHSLTLCVQLLETLTDLIDLKTLEYYVSAGRDSQSSSSSISGSRVL